MSQSKQRQEATRPVPNGWLKWTRRRAAFFSLAAIALILAPLAENLSEKPKDDFPLSYYPMFTAKRRDATTVRHALAVRSNGEVFPLKYKFLGTGGMNQVRRQTRKIVREGGAEMLCHRAAKRVARSSRKSVADVVEIRIVTRRYSLDGFFGGDTTPLKETINATCKVEPKS